MLWKEITLTLPRDQIEIYEDTLLELGAVSITLKDAKDNPIFEPEINETPLWDELELTALFTEENDLKLIITKLHDTLNISNLPPYTTQSYPDKDWERTWLEHFKPIKLGKRLWICPSNYKAPDPKAVNIILDPGLAFGTGSHPTTELCLSYLDETINGNETVIDYGCGSGILAIASIKLGAKKVLGIDIDPQAIIASNDNAIRNKLNKDNYQFVLNNQIPNNFTCDTLVANILANPLINLAPIISNYIKPKGKIALSGILKEQSNLIIKAYEPYFELGPIKIKEQWVLVTGIKKTI